jgi:hypothetical protein
MRAAALAAAAAAGKGVGLSSEGLGEYAAAIDPGYSNQHGEAGDGGASRDRGRKKAPPLPAEAADDGDALRELAEKTEADHPLTGMLNRIPGADGRRWAVFPFHFALNGAEFRVSVRILLMEHTLIEQRVARMAVDILRDAGAGRRRWLFIMDKPGKPEARTDIYADPPLSGEACGALEGEIREALAGALAMTGPVILRMDEPLPLFADSVADSTADSGVDNAVSALLPVNEEV